MEKEADGDFAVESEVCDSYGDEGGIPELVRERLSKLTPTLDGRKAEL